MWMDVRLYSLFVFNEDGSDPIQIQPAKCTVFILKVFMQILLSDCIFIIWALVSHQLYRQRSKWPENRTQISFAQMGRDNR